MNRPTNRPNDCPIRRPLRGASALGLAAVMSAIFVLAACTEGSGGLGTLPVASSDSATASPIASLVPDVTPGSASPLSSPSSGPVGSAPTSATTSAPTAAFTPAPTGTTVVRAYFLLPDGRLVPVLRAVPKTLAVAGAAIGQLLAGPNATERSSHIVSAVPVGTELLGVTISNGTATVDLSSGFQDGGGSASMFARLAQVVYTLTQFPTVDRVSFLIAGQPVTVFSSEGIVLDGPQARSDYQNQLAAIWVDRPAWGGALGNPGRVTGSANVFEAQFRITLLDAAGHVLLDQPVMATCGTGCWGTFDVTIRYAVAKAQYGTLRVWDASMKDGTPQDVRDYPVWLTPAP